MIRDIRETYLEYAREDYKSAMQLKDINRKSACVLLFYCANNLIKAELNIEESSNNIHELAKNLETPGFYLDLHLGALIDSSEAYTVYEELGPIYEVEDLDVEDSIEIVNNLAKELGYSLE